MVEERCPECGADFETVWQARVGTGVQGYEPAFGKGTVAVALGRCKNCNISFESTDGGVWHRQGDL